jgi:large subunit ribosomal protein L24
MHVKKNDNVVVLTGKDKGKKGKVVRAMPKLNMVVIEGINIRKRHRRARKEGEKGQIISIETPVHASNVRKAQ